MEVPHQEAAVTRRQGQSLTIERLRRRTGRGPRRPRPAGRHGGHAAVGKLALSHLGFAPVNGYSKFRTSWAIMAQPCSTRTRSHPATLLCSCPPCRTLYTLHVPTDSHDPWMHSIVSPPQPAPPSPCRCRVPGRPPRPDHRTGHPRQRRTSPATRQRTTRRSFAVRTAVALAHPTTAAAPLSPRA